MGFSDELDEVVNARPGRPPRLYERITADWSPEDKEALEAAIDNPEVSAAAIWRVLRGRGYELSKSSVADWCRVSRARK